MNAKFNLPDFVIGEPAYRYLSYLFKEHPEVFYPNTEMSAIFGNFNSCIWNGGGIDIEGSVSRGFMEDIVGLYNYDLHLPLRLTFTNVFCSKEQTFDTYANTIAEVFHNGKNEILVVNSVLEEYLRKTYPNFKYCRSIISARETPYALHGPLGDYDLSVMQRIKNNDWDYLNTIPMEDRTHIEFLCTDPCPDKCPRLYTHYRDFARCQIEFREPNECESCSMTEVKGEFPHHYLKTELHTYISREMIDNEYMPNGFNQFKISGRRSQIGILIGILNYMVKPEYHDDIMGQILGRYGLN